MFFGSCGPGIIPAMMFSGLNVVHLGKVSTVKYRTPTFMATFLPSLYMAQKYLKLKIHDFDKLTIYPK